MQLFLLIFLHYIAVQSQVWRHVAGPLPVHHPKALKELLQQGRAAAASRLLRTLLTYLQRCAAAASAAAQTPAASAAQAESATLAAAPATAAEHTTTSADASAIATTGTGASAACSLGSAGGAAALTMSARDYFMETPLEQPGLAALAQFTAAAARHPLSSTTEHPTSSAAAGKSPGVHIRGTAPFDHAPTHHPAATAVQAPASQASPSGQGPGAAAAGSWSAPAMATSSIPFTGRDDRSVSAVPPSAVDTGMLDMSAFGFGSSTQSQPAAEAATNKSSSSVETGMWDMSAFGSFAGAATAEPQPSHKPSPPPSSVETGMLDMSAFGMGGGAGEAKPAPKPAPAASSMDTGLLDMSAFESGASSSSSQPHPPPATSSTVQTGMLDTSAFGFGGGSSSSQPPPFSNNAMQTGMLDMSAFGGGSGSSSQPPQSSSNAMQTGMLDMSTFGFGGGGTSQPSPSTSTAMQTGMLDMSAFGAGGSSQSAAVAESGPSRATSASAAAAVPANEPSSAAVPPAQQDAGPSSEMTGLRFPPSAAGRSIGISAHQASQPAGAELLTAAEVTQLCELLGVPPPTLESFNGRNESGAPGERPIGSQPPSNAASSLATTAQAAADLLGLSSDEVGDLLHIAVALSEYSPWQQEAGGASASPEQLQHLRTGLDPSGRVFLVLGQLAALHSRRTAENTPAVDTSRHAMMQSAFQGVTVSRTPAKGAAAPQAGGSPPQVGQNPTSNLNSESRALSAAGDGSGSPFLSRAQVSGGKSTSQSRGMTGTIAPGKHKRSMSLLSFSSVGSLSDTLPAQVGDVARGEESSTQSFGQQVG